MPVVGELQVMQQVMLPLVMQTDWGAAGDPMVRGNADGDFDASGPLLGLLEDPGKRNSIEVSGRDGGCAVVYAPGDGAVGDGAGDGGAGDTQEMVPLVMLMGGCRR